MKKIVDGKKYDTETAEFIGKDSYSNPGDLNHWEEALYLTKNGSYFLAGSGGPMSKYCEKVEQNSWGGSSKIFPLDEDEAFEWAARHLPVSVVEGYFPGYVTEA